MKIKMAGIDYSSATVTEREAFAFTASQLQKALAGLKCAEGVKGCAIISTCNRTELWISGEGGEEDPAGLLCAAKGIGAEAGYEPLMNTREGHEAMTHLFETACGLRSQVLGEDQILAQVKAALEQSREARATDDAIEKLFQTAIASAKRIKTKVRLTTADASVAHAAVQNARGRLGSLSGAKCLVIGNGEMGRLTAELLAAEGADVAITHRRHSKSGKPAPDRCRAADYDLRFDEMRECDVIVSATVSPHHTIKKEDVEWIAHTGRQFLFIDLALPRDIDQRVGEYENAILINVDNIGMDLAVDRQALSEAKRIMAEHMQDFHKWVLSKKYIGMQKDGRGSPQAGLSADLRREVASLPEELWVGGASDMDGMVTEVMKAMKKARGKVLVVGTGPGELRQMTGRASEALLASDVIVGYKVYVDLIREHFPGKEFISSPMKRERERCETAVKEAACGKTVALISSGDAGVYGMASVAIETAEKHDVEVEVVPGVTAALSGGALLGAPIANDFAAISLSDLLTPWEVIEKRLAAAAAGDFAIAIYNPGSKGRKGHLAKACRILLKHKPKDTPCGIVRNVGRGGQTCRLLTLSELAEAEADMFTTVFVGSRQTSVLGGRMVTMRGYGAT